MNYPYEHLYVEQAMLYYIKGTPVICDGDSMKAVIEDEE